MSRIETSQPADHSTGKKDNLSLLGFYATALPFMASLLLTELWVKAPLHRPIKKTSLGKSFSSKKAEKPALHFKPQENALIVPSGGNAKADIGSTPYVFDDFVDTQEVRIRWGGRVERRRDGTWRMRGGNTLELDKRKNTATIDNGVTVEYKP